MNTIKRNLWALTIHQPWAAAIVHGTKDIENRKWKPNGNKRGDYLCIHASKTYINDPVVEHIIWDVNACDISKDQIVMGAIVGVAKIDNFVQKRFINSPWAAGDDDSWCWILRDIVPLINPIETRGYQGLWSVNGQLMEAVRSEFAKSRKA